MNKYVSLLAVIVFSFSVTGCMVTRSTYQKNVQALDNCSRERATLQEKYTNENNHLSEKINSLAADRDQLKEAFANAAREKNELDALMQATSDNLKKTIMELRKKNLDLEGENQIFAENLAAEEKIKSGERQAIHKREEELLAEMKEEIAKGQITIKEFKGTLTVNILDGLLYNSGEVELKKGGTIILSRLLNILKNMDAKSIRIEGHTDNTKLKTPLSKKYPGNWEFAAARAINVMRFLQKQGIDPVRLSATSYGEYRPIADNSTPEGRSVNRRISIILLPEK